MPVNLQGAGLGLRRSFLQPLADGPPADVGFYEIAPENWIPIGGRDGRLLRKLTERCDFVCHGLSLSLGSPDPLDRTLVRAVKKFMAEHRIGLYSEHLSCCSVDGHLYDLMPIPFTAEAVGHVAARIRQVQDMLEQRIALENVSYYAAPGAEMTEADFLGAVVEEADCLLLLDLNNVYVNSVNHRYSAEAFLKALPAGRVAYAHVAGHYRGADGFLVDTHGAGVIDPVWRLLHRAYELFGIFPTLLERDFNVPPLPELMTEVRAIADLQQAWQRRRPA